MAKFSKLQSFIDDWKKLSPHEKALFMAAVKQMNEDLTQPGRQFRPGLFVKAMSGKHLKGIYEMSWEKKNGRATFHYGPNGEIVWRRIGGHEIYKNP